MYQNKENSYIDARITTTLLDFVSAKTDNHAAVIVSDQHKTHYAQLSLLTVQASTIICRMSNTSIRALNTGSGTLRFISSPSSLSCTEVVPNWWYNRRNSNVAVYVVYLVLDDNVLNQDSIETPRRHVFT